MPAVESGRVRVRISVGLSGLSVLVVVVTYQRRCQDGALHGCRVDRAGTAGRGVGVVFDRAFRQIVVKAATSVLGANDAPEHHGLPFGGHRGVYVAVVESGEQCQHGSALIGFESRYGAVHD